jgi:hypothetical protein
LGINEDIGAPAERTTEKLHNKAMQTIWDNLETIHYTITVTKHDTMLPQ